MSLISRLSITGIRSFAGDDSENIEFKPPLTLIWGVNGSGKTTIIECLKYATTGFLPPNSKGGAFINDPMLHGKPTTNAQVKIGFKSVNGESMIGTRTMRLDVKNGKHTFKSIEAHLSRIKKDGTRTNVSGKGFDYDSEVCNALGVSKAVLDNVIFCHQDESYWPLSEASVLKKKFDDIFQASQFTRILDNLKAINKEIIADSKLIEKSVEYLSNDKKRVDALNKECNDLKDDVTNLENSRKKIKFKRMESETELNEIFKTNQEFQLILSKYEQCNYTRTTLVQQCERLKNSIEIYPDSLDDLMLKLNNFNDILDNYNQKIMELSSINETLSNKLNDKRSNLTELSKTEGLLSSKKNDYIKDLEAFKSLTKSDISTLDIDSYKKKLNEKVTASESLLNEHKVNASHQKAEKNKIINSLSEIISNHNNLKQIKSENKSEINNKIKTLKEKIYSLDSNEDTLNFEKNELKNLNKKFEESINSNFVKKLNSDIEINSKQVKLLEIEVDEVSSKIQKYNTQKETVVRINYLKEINDQKQIAVTSNLNKINKIIPGINKDNFETIFNERFKTISDEYNDLKKSNDSINNEKNSISALIGSNKQSMVNLTNQFNTTKLKILKVIPESEIDEYDITIEDLESNYHDSLESFNTYEISKNFKIKAIEIGKKHQTCFMCHRSFDKPALSGFISALEADIAKPHDEYKKTLDEDKKVLDNYKSISADYVRYKSLINELKEIDHKQEELDKKLSSINENYLEVDMNLQDAKDKLDEFEKTKILINEISKDLLTMKNNNERLESLSKDLGDSAILTDSIDELNKLQNDKNLALKNLRVQVGKDIELKHNKERELSKLESSIKDKEIKIKNIESSLQDLKQSQDLLEEYEMQINEINEQINETVNKLNKVIEEKNNEQQSSNELFEKLDSKESTLTDEYNEVKNNFVRISNLIESIANFEKNDKELIEVNSKSIIQLNSEIDSLILEIETNNNEIKSYEKKVGESSNIKSLIRDNIDYKTYVNDLSKLEQEIKDLNVEEAEAQKSQYLQQTEHLNSIISDLNAEDAGKLGEIRQINERIKSLESKLNVDYKDVDKDYHEAWIDLQTHLLISNDIVTYSKSLDNAIMKYHSLKMTEINAILKHSWGATYKNSDIDYIAIRSDPVSQTKGNKSYNYRVVMQKGNQEIDMRGRCSAGQRVLTSILIRLALAESFGSNCGIIALDEPTTNLDTDNVKSLAESLDRLIRARREQPNFQLIIITHDVDFLTHMNGSSYTDVYYQVSKDDNLFSTIKAGPINQMEERVHAT